MKFNDSGRDEVKDKEKYRVRQEEETASSLHQGLRQAVQTWANDATMYKYIYFARHKEAEW